MSRFKIYRSCRSPFLQEVAPWFLDGQLFLRQNRSFHTSLATQNGNLQEGKNGDDNRVKDDDRAPSFWNLPGICRDAFIDYRESFSRAMYGLKARPKVVIPDDGNQRFIPTERFIPYNRYHLQSELLKTQAGSIVGLERLEKLALTLETRLTREMSSHLNDMKKLYGPISSDRNSNPVEFEEQEERETLLLDVMSGVLDKANFYELPESFVNTALTEHETGEGVLVTVHRQDYKVLRVWALGRQKPDEVIEPHYKVQLRELYYKLLNERPLPKPLIFKRVVIAVRHESENSLRLNMYRAVPTGALENLLPHCTIRMARADQIRILTALFISAIAMSGDLALAAGDTPMKWPFIGTALTASIIAAFWRLYTKKKTKYLMQLSKALYRQNMASNQGLLTFVVDLARDEVIKEALVTYVHMTSCMGHDYIVDKPTLDRNIQDWLRDVSGNPIDFDSSNALKLLKEINILQLTPGDENHQRIMVNINKSKTSSRTVDISDTPQM